MWPLSRSPVGTRRAWRKREELRLRVSGKYGPEWWEVLPAFGMVLVVIGLPLLCLGWLWARIGWWAALLAAAALGYAVRAGVRRRRAVLARRRRRAVCFSLEQVDAADDRAFRAIVGRLLLRDGWTHVRGVRIRAEVVHLVGAGPDGRQLGVAFERGIERAGQGGRAALRPVGGVPELLPGIGPRALFLVVSSGSFARERVVWAVRNDVRLVDRLMLQRWAAGEHLAVLLGLGLDDARPDAS
ncbi:hypothetical protein [Streptomyces mobaraensis]|uniref:Restriction endonuclease n=1 Tax=Streptomyces mobaraensis TaxID=35621 RepID=A0A5N5VXL4_STRMB|nr:hypothetical protein [Streptomyces mobaraensis]KAB7833539.1 hypothetical protein FRZ00_33365 [Streptomyces mobaraensis]